MARLPDLAEGLYSFYDESPYRGRVKTEFVVSLEIGSSKARDSDASFQMSV